MRRAEIFRRCWALALLLGVSGLARGEQSPSVSVNVVYKMIDGQGRVTDANEPSVGGVSVDLQPLTIIPSTPGGSLGDAARAANLAVLAKPISVEQARRESASQQALSIARTTSSAQQAAQVAQQRRDEVRRRIIDGELETEQQLIDEARNELEAEQKRSNALRTMRASMGSAAPEESRVTIERHFERIRDLQDQITLHEENITDMKAQLRPTSVVKQARRADAALAIR